MTAPGDSPMTLIEEAEAMAERYVTGTTPGSTLRWHVTDFNRETAALIRRMADELRKAGEYVEIERLGRG